MNDDLWMDLRKIDFTLSLWTTLNCTYNNVNEDNDFDSGWAISVWYEMICYMINEFSICSIKLVDCANDFRTEWWWYINDLQQNNMFCNNLNKQNLPVSSLHIIILFTIHIHVTNTFVSQPLHWQLRKLLPNWVMAIISTWAFEIVL